MGELKKFSFAFILLLLVPVFLMLIYVLVMAVKFSRLNVQQGLVVLLGFLLVVYFLLPSMASRVLGAIISSRKPARAVAPPRERKATA